jgi:hypothetical protein
LHYVGAAASAGGSESVVADQLAVGSHDRMAIAIDNDFVRADVPQWI